MELTNKPNVFFSYTTSLYAPYMERANQLHHMCSMEFRPPKHKVVIGCVVVVMI